MSSNFLTCKYYTRNFESGLKLIILNRCIALAGFHDYYNVSMIADQSNKHIENRLIWIYYIVRNYIEYGMENFSLRICRVGKFPIDLIKDIFILCRFQE
jgi:hypothetical protein